jgi:hypothetical protein
MTSFVEVVLDCRFKQSRCWRAALASVRSLVCLTDLSVQDSTREHLGIQQQGLSQTPEGVKRSDVVPL